MWTDAFRRVAGTSTIAALLAGCSGGAGSIPRSTAPAAQQAAPVASTATSPTTTKIALTIPAGLKPAYVSPSTQGVAISVYGVSATPPPGPTQTYDVSSTSSACTTGASGSRNCTLSITAPAGNDYFAVSAYDAKPVSGAIPLGAHVLSSGTTQAYILANAPNTLPLSLGGLISSIAIAPPAYSVPFGTAHLPIPFTVQALDAQGNTILGTNAFVNPISLSISDSHCATFSFSSVGCATAQTLPAAPTSGFAPVTLYTNGNSFTANVTLTASTTVSGGTVSATAQMQPGTAGGSLTVVVPGYPTAGIAVGNPTGNGTVDLYAPGYPGTSASPVVQLSYSGQMFATQIAFDAFGNLYVADSANLSIDVWSPSAAASGSAPTYVIQSSDFSDPVGVAVDSYGNVYESDSGGGCGESVHRAPQSARQAVRVGLRRNDSPTPCYGAIYAFRPSSYQAGGQPYTGVHDWAISGTNTGMSNPGQLAVDSSNNVILAQTYDSDELVYAVAASGNVAPSLTIPGPSIPSGCNYGYVDGLSAYSGGIIVSWSGETCSYVALNISTGFTYSVTGGTSSQTFQLQGIQNATVDAYGNLAGFTSTYDGAGAYTYFLVAYPPNFAATTPPNAIGQLTLPVLHVFLGPDERFGCPGRGDEPLPEREGPLAAGDIGAPLSSGNLFEARKPRAKIGLKKGEASAL